MLTGTWTIVGAGVLAAVLLAVGVGIDITGFVILGAILLVGAVALGAARKIGAMSPGQCPHCGGLVSPNAPYCKHCGELL